MGFCAKHCKREIFETGLFIKNKLKFGSCRLCINSFCSTACDYFVCKTIRICFCIYTLRFFTSWAHTHRHTHLYICIRQHIHAPYPSCPHLLTFGGHRSCRPLSDSSPKPSSRPICLAAGLPYRIFQCHVTMPTGLGQGPGRQSALEAVSSGSVWQHANICKWRGPAMTPAHRRNGLCPFQQRTQDGGCTAQHTHSHSYTQKDTQAHCSASELISQCL